MIARGRLVLGVGAFLFALLVVASGGLVAPALADIDHVTNCNDGGTGSLRAAVDAAANGDTVVFDLDCTGAAQITVSGEILVESKAVTVDGSGHDITISGGDSTRIFNAGAGSTVTLDHLRLTHGSSGDGGAVVVTGNLTLEDSTVSSSTTSSTGGGAIATFGGTLTVRGSDFVGNNAPVWGGAIYIDSSTASIETSTFTGNHAGTGGGGVGTDSGVVTISRSTFSGNVVDNAGGAIAAIEGPNLTLVNSTVTDNTAPSGGALYTTDGTARLVNVTLSGDHISVGMTGGEIFTFGTVTASNTIISGTSGTNCSGGTIINGGNNLQFGDTSCGFSLTADPRLGPLAGNAGPTRTMALGQGSPAIGAANPSICTGAQVGNVDQRGLARTDATRTACDIGAYDTGGAVPGAASGTTTTITCSVCEIPVGGKKTQLTVQAKSATGQSLTIGGDTVTLTTTRGTLSAVTDNGNGTYTASFASPNKKGKVIVSGTIDGQQITSTATIKVAPAPPSVGTTTITARRVNVPQARGRTKIVVNTRDRFKNEIPTGGARVRLETTAGTLRGVRDLHNGAYTAILRRNKADDQKVVVTGTINGKRIKDNAVVFFK